MARLSTTGEVTALAGDDMIRRASPLVLLLLVVFGASALLPSATARGEGTPALVLHAPEAVLGNGDDFATTVLGDPWDMDRRRDIGWEENFSDIEVKEGVWSGRVRITNPAAGDGAYVFPLFQGFKGAWPVGSIGANYPVDASVYTHLSYRMYVSERAGPHAVYWTHEVDWPDGSQFFAFYDGAPPGWKIYSFDLTATNGDPGHQRGSWGGGPVYGLRLDPNPLATELGVKIDWIRLTDPSTSPRYLLTWTAQGLSQDARLGVYVDTDRQGYDGSLVATVPVAAGSYELPTCILGGGEYYLYLRSGDVFSNYGERLTINNPPVLQWDLSTAGVDYASSELGDPWDMSGPEDLMNLQGILLWDEYYALRQFYDWEFTEGIFTAVADSNYAYRHYRPLKQSDVQVWLNIDQSRPVDSSRYRYLVIRLKIEEGQERTISQRVQDGWVARVIWWNEGIHVDGFCTDDIVLYEGWNTYVIDLMARDRPEGYSPEGSSRPWAQMGQVLHLRFDPLEVSEDTRFYIDEVRLLSGPVADQVLRLHLGVGDADGDPVDVLYGLDTDRDGFDGHWLQSASTVRVQAAAMQPAGHALFIPFVSRRPEPEVRPLLSDGPLSVIAAEVDTASLPPGVYHLYACASDGISETCRYLPRPVTVAR